MQETVTILLEQREEVIKPQELGGRILKRMVTLYAFILCTGNKSLYQLQEELYQFSSLFIFMNKTMV